jgi:hypothetical protein
VTAPQLMSGKSRNHWAESESEVPICGVELPLITGILLRWIATNYR